MTRKACGSDFLYSVKAGNPWSRDPERTNASEGGLPDRRIRSCATSVSVPERFRPFKRGSRSEYGDGVGGWGVGARERKERQCQAADNLNGRPVWLSSRLLGLSGSVDPEEEDSTVINTDCNF